MDWTQPICENRWMEMYVDRAPIRVQPEAADPVIRCCYCNQITESGIYIRVDPKTVPFPQEL